jgi:hypothetical protein
MDVVRIEKSEATHLIHVLVCREAKSTHIDKDVQLRIWNKLIIYRTGRPQRSMKGGAKDNGKGMAVQDQSSGRVSLLH